ncbi:hypothetical protein P152DRAFT_338937 [Eremomyces bilateralis CBS 781.70]|uniref:PWWP domain-containing protein n=1 Tax=Eremomyces bilateralis CBS 781.70 TaxID=1392243 RepID=A0A6G1G3Q4_9PEZI|nr:uncharacterized protein P152DRAFT_338937 [Eremomyces bilateralis CBS 781.70]KAF1812449.1 hypothetical protein P152DRAFT_338937 [Eremomyces bilateralis CBS 781.70]
MALPPRQTRPPIVGSSRMSRHLSSWLLTLYSTSVDAVPQTETSSAEPAATKESEAGSQKPANEGTNGAEASADTIEPLAATTNGATDATKRDRKRKSSSGVPEHKSKKLNRKKSMPQLQLDVEPGQFWFARMRGHQPWPSVICDEQMLPISLLSKRPVSAKRVDGTWRADFEVGGKNVRDRRYPVMFLATNEFAWQPNTDLLPLDMNEIKEKVESGNQGKMPNTLWEAYKTAAGEHSLTHFKSVLMEHEKAMVKEQEDREQEEELLKQQIEAADKAAAEQAEKKKEKAEQQKKSKKKGKSDDVEMADADGTAKASKSKKRKKGEAADTDAEEGTKPPKTPKLKLTNKSTDTPAAASDTKSKKASKPSAKKAAFKDTAPKEEKKQETEAEKLEKRQKLVLFLRHRLQKGFLDKNTPPKDEDMPDMSLRLSDLEKHENLEVSIIKATKINKVLKQLLRIEYIPRDEEFHFRQRATDLLGIYNKSMELETPTPAPAASTGAAAPKSEEPEVKTNGVNHEEPAKEGASPDEKNEVKSVEAEEPKKDTLEVAEGDGDISMTDAKADMVAPEEAPERAAETAADAPVASTEEPSFAT